MSYCTLHTSLAPGLASTERNNSRLLGTLPKLIYDRRLAWLFFGLYGILVEIMPSQRRGRPHRLKPRFRETRNNATDIVTRAILDRLRCVIVFSLCRVRSSSACSFSGVSCFRKSATTTDAVQEKLWRIEKEDYQIFFLPLIRITRFQQILSIE